MSIGMSPKKPPKDATEQFFQMLHLIQNPDEYKARVNELVSASARHEEATKKAAKQAEEQNAKLDAREADLEKREQDFSDRLHGIERREAKVTATEKRNAERVIATKKLIKEIGEIDFSHNRGILHGQPTETTPPA